MLSQETFTLQTEALQRIHIFRLFDVYALLDCLYHLCSSGLQQVSLQFLLHKIHHLHLWGPQKSNLVTFCIRCLLAVAL